VDRSYRVHVHRKGGASEHALREGGELIFGRDPECSVPLNDGRVSRRHAILRLRGGGLEVLDLGSRNGTTVDGAKIAPNTAVQARETSVLRIGEAVVTLELARAAGDSPWCFDRGTFTSRAEAALAQPRKGVAALVEIAWESEATATTTSDTAGPPVGLQQVLTKLVGPNGVIGAHEGSRLLLVLPSTEAERIDATIELVKGICTEHDLAGEIRLATSDKPRLDALLAALSRRMKADLVPPVIFQGGLRSVDALLAKLDASEAPVLIVGETGVGKDVLARALHARSKRSQKPLVSLNCAAFTEALFESELFGHERGAFTGAQTAKTGLLESAAGGTVFLDEIGEMPLSMQAKLLRVVENREVLRVGALQPRQIDVRFVFATNRDLHREVEQKTFRQDLFFRIGSITLRIPPLRERVDEIVPLAEHFIANSSAKIGRTPPRLLPETARFLEGHAWPGNVRELKHVIELASLVADGDVIRPSDIHIERYLPADSGAAPSSLRASPPPSFADAEAATSATAPREKSERDRMLEALEKTLWNQSKAAELIGMPRRTFVKRLAQYDLPRPRKRDT
jgi:DNA-binding NtrC family response regulator